MKSPIIFIFVASVFLNLTSCVKDNYPDDYGKVEVKFSLDESVTRAYETTWTAGDAIGIYMKKAGETLGWQSIMDETFNRNYQTDTGNGFFSPESPGQTIYYPNEGQNVDFIAYYPRQSAISNFIYPVDVSSQTDQESIDLLYSDNAKNKYKPDPIVLLEFRHMLTNFIFNVKPGGELTAADLEGLKITVAGTHTKGDFSLMDGLLTHIGTTGDIAVNMRADGTKGQAIVLPSPEVVPGPRSFRFQLRNHPELTYLISSETVFPGSTQYTYEVTISHDRVEVDHTVRDWVIASEEEMDIYEHRGLYTPNCYMVKPGNSQNIPIYKLFAVWKSQTFLAPKNVDLTGAISSRLIWEDNQGLITNNYIDGIDHTGQLIVRTAQNKTGNAVVGVWVGDTLRWSWHIWVTDYDPGTAGNTIIYNSGKRVTEFMDRNLGALTNTVSTLSTLGLYYQWGRKDPFPGPRSVTAGNTAQHIDIYGPGGASRQIVREKVSAVQNIPNSIYNPLTFYWVTPYQSGGREEWYSSNDGTYHNFLWATATGEKGIYDPCPLGWRVPWGENTQDSPWYLAGASTSGGGAGDYEGTAVHGFNFLSSKYPLGYYPAAGAIKSDDGEFREVGTVGYWNSSKYILKETHIMRIDVSSNSVGTWQTVNRRSYGFSIRCVRDEAT